MYSVVFAMFPRGATEVKIVFAEIIYYLWFLTPIETCGYCFIRSVAKIKQNQSIDCYTATSFVVLLWAN